MLKFFLLSCAQTLNKTSKDLVLLAMPLSEVKPVEIKYMHHANCGDDGFNELAALFLRSGTVGVKFLFKRGAPHLFSASALLLFFFVYTILAAVTSGIGVPSGLFIPHLLIGNRPLSSITFPTLNNPATRAFSTVFRCFAAPLPSVNHQVLRSGASSAC